MDVIEIKVAGTKQEAISKLFTINDTGKVIFLAMPTAMSRNALTPEELFHDWQEFRDYIMEGFVIYQMKLEDKGEIVEILVKLYGTPRDQYIESALKFYVEASGFIISE